MSQALLDHVAASSTTKRVPVLKPGYTVRVHQKIKEGDKQRIQVFEGLIIRLNSGSGVNKTFTVRKVVDGIGVEKILPLYSPNIEKIEVVKQGKVRRAKLYYMRSRSGKSARLQEQALGEIQMQGGEPEEPVEEVAVEAPAEETPVVEESAQEETPEPTPAEEPEPAEEPKAEEAQAEKAE